jgi:hypothetical protein
MFKIRVRRVGSSASAGHGGGAAAGQSREGKARAKAASPSPHPPPAHAASSASHHAFNWLSKKNVTGRRRAVRTPASARSHVRMSPAAGCPTRPPSRPNANPNATGPADARSAAVRSSSKNFTASHPVEKSSSSAGRAEASPRRHRQHNAPGGDASPAPPAHSAVDPRSGAWPHVECASHAARVHSATSTLNHVTPFASACRHAPTSFAEWAW